MSHPSPPSGPGPAPSGVEPGGGAPAVDPYGRPVDTYGRLIDPYGRLINEYGRLVDEHGRLIDEYGRLINEFGRPIDEYGRPIDEYGQPARAYVDPSDPHRDLERDPIDPNRQLADHIPGAVAHDIYAGSEQPSRAYPRSLASPPLRDASPWNLPAFGLVAIFLIALVAVVYPQVRARKVEGSIRPLVAKLSERDAGARCPRYLTSVLTDVGSVSLDNNGTIADHTDLTGPICDAMRHLYTSQGRAEMRCLVTTGQCTPAALKSVVALSTVAHESMHLKGVLDEREAECQSIGAATLAGTTAGLSPEEGRMIGYLHMASMNPNTPDQYHVSPDNCSSAADLVANPPGTEAQRALLQTTAEQAWITLASG